jgi:hypothetical protein
MNPALARKKMDSFCRTAGRQRSFGNCAKQTGKLQMNLRVVAIWSHWPKAIVIPTLFLLFAVSKRAKADNRISIR